MSAAPTAPIATALYCYGVSRSGAAPPALAGVGGAPVETVTVGGIAALTSRIESVDVRARRRDLVAHSDVLTAACEDGTVLPLWFGAAFMSEQALCDEFLGPRQDELKALLAEFDGRVELTVKAVYLEDAILTELIAEDARALELRDEIRSVPEAATYGLRLAL